MFDYLRIAAAVPTVKVADIRFNTQKMIEKIDEADGVSADVVVFPELSVTGYSCADLFLQQTILNGAVIGIHEVVKKTSGCSMLIVFGAPITIGSSLYNCAVFAADGKILGIVPKTFIPNYGEYYEKRWFSSSEELNVGDISAKELGFLDDYRIPISRNLILNINGSYTIGAEICEDIWAPLPPSTFLATAGAEVIVNLSASNEIIGKRNYRKNIISSQSARTICAYIYCSAGCGESTTDLVFSGHSMIAENGKILEESSGTICDDYLLVSDIDLGIIRADRMKNTSFSDCNKIYGIKPYIEVINNDNIRTRSDGGLREISKLPFVPSKHASRLERCNEIFEMQVCALIKRLSIIGAKAVIGVSGGLDSTLALLVSTEAMRRMGRAPKDVIGITLPCFGTTDRTHDNAVKLMRQLGITDLEINIKNACNLHYSDIGHDGKTLDLTYENTQARERTQVLMDYAGKVGGIVIGTGDLSEMALGWCTYNGDHMSMYGVNCSIPKTLIRWMISSIAEYDIFTGCKDILKDIIDTPISPELLPPDAKGDIAQKTESLVGPYALHDFFLYYTLRYGFEPIKIFTLAKRAFSNDFSEAEILKWLKTFYRRFFTQQFKRSCMPDGVKVGSVALSPRGDLRMPSDASAAYFMELADKLSPQS